MAPIDDFEAQLGALGLEVTRVNDFLTFPYEVPVGRHRGTTVTIGLEVPGDFPATPPPGPNVSPRLGHADGNVHASQLPGAWEYWSRPCPDWASTSRTAEEYMAHVRTVFSRA